MPCECGGTCECGGDGKVTLDTSQVLELKNFSDPERAKLAKKGEAMPGGGFPIHNSSDLHNAIQAVGRAKNPGAAKAWIKKRARELNMESELPAAWELSARIEALELAIIGLATQSFGDSEGHPFHGNQYGGGGEGNHSGTEKTGGLGGALPRELASVPGARLKTSEAAVGQRVMIGGSKFNSTTANNDPHPHAGHIGTIAKISRESGYGQATGAIYRVKLDNGPTITIGNPDVPNGTLRKLAGESYTGSGDAKAR